MPSSKSATKRVSRCLFQTFVYFYHYLGKISNLTSIFQMGWFNHQLGLFFLCFVALLTWRARCHGADFFLKAKPGSTPGFNRFKHHLSGK